MYEGDTPNAERRAAALSLDRDLLRELLGQEELRELIDPDALAEVEADLQRTSERTRAANADGLHDVLRAVGDLTADGGAGALPRGGRRRGACSPSSSASGARCGCGSAARSAAIAAEDAGLYRDALGAVPPGGLPGRLPRGGRGAARAARPPLRAHPRPVHDARALGPLRGRLRARCCASSSAPASLVRGELRPGGSEREWCDPEVLRRLRRASLATLRKEVEPAEQRALARFLPAWQGVDAAPARRRGRRPPARGARAAPGPGARARGVGARRAAAPASAPTRRPGSTSSARAASSSGSAPARSAAAPGRVALYFREDARWLGPPPLQGRAARRSRCTSAIRERLERGAAFWTDLLADLDEVEPARAPGGALGPGLGRRGHQRRLRAAARAAALARQARPRAPAAASRAAAGPARRRSRAAGRSPRRCSRTRRRTGRACARSPSCCSSATGS